MTKFYQVTFCWKSPRGKRVTQSSSPFIFSSYEEADDYGSTLLYYEKRKAEQFKYRHSQLICDYYIDSLVLEDSNTLIEILKSNQGGD